jgi:hypothetical protein
MNLNPSSPAATSGLQPGNVIIEINRHPVAAFHEPQRAAGILPAEDAWLCRRDVGSTLLGRTFAWRQFMVPRRDHKIVEASHEPGRGIYPAGSSARSRSVGVVRRPQHRAFLRTKVRAPSRLMAPMRVQSWRLKPMNLVGLRCRAAHLLSPRRRSSAALSSSWSQ